MDYIFRWLQLRFLSGTQLTLFAGLSSQPQPSVEPLSLTAEAEPDANLSSAPGSGVVGVSGAALTKLVEDIARRLNQVSSSAPETGSVASPSGSTEVPKMADRGLYHASDAMREMYDMGDAPSCGTCGAIMVRNGSCYRCMSCGSTSGCS
jgi:ribonucleoside-diphosphate reductase alpha chain